jgi:hypothetical protein
MLERYHHFFIDPWGTILTIDHLNHGVGGEAAGGGA